MGAVFDVGAVYTLYRFNQATYPEMAAMADIIQSSTMARPEGYQFMPRYRKGTWDGFIRLTKQNRIPTGLLHRVVDNLRSNSHFHIELTNNAHKPEAYMDRLRPDMFEGITLRQYQAEAVFESMSAGRGILKMATNSGKTLVIAAMARLVDCPVLVLTTKKDLLHQTAERLENRLQEKVGLVGDGYWEPERVTVGMIQTLNRHLTRMQYEFEDLGMVVFDECHHVPSKTAQAVMYSLPAPYRFGMSGTPMRYTDLNDMVLIGATGPVLFEVTNEDLIRSGVSAKPVVDMHSIEAEWHTGTWQEAYSAHIVESDARNTMIAKLVMGKKADSTLILVDRIEHGDRLRGLIPGAIFVHGSHTVEERKHALDMLRQGNGAMIISTPIFDEGVDVPAVSRLVLAGGGKGHIKLLQRIGRGMRQKNENVLQVIDFVDDTNGYLLSHSYERARIYEQEGFEVVVHE